MKRFMLAVSGGAAFVIFLILLAVTVHMENALPEQQMADRWSSESRVAQVSCFFAVDAGVNEDTFFSFGRTLDNALKEASIELESENPGARLWVDAYSADGKVNIVSDRAKLEAEAIGIGGDFFLFHPLKLLAGGYFSGNDLMQDYCILDQDAAWQLFGSYDIVGMTVYISEIPHIVTGVVERPSGKLEAAAGLDSTVVYVSYKTLHELGSSNGINHYEIIMPDPVKGFAYDQVKNSMGVGEKQIEIVENSRRFDLLSRIKAIGSFGSRSMNGKAIIYPYWENMARGYEDRIALLTVFMILFLLYPLVLYGILFGIWWRRKGWTIRDIWHHIKDEAERFMEKRRARCLELKEQQKDDELVG